MEGLIARPIEAELQSLQSLSDVRTVVGQGSVRIEARFAEGTAATGALQDVNGVIGRINGSLPNGATLTTEISGNAINEVADYAVQIPDGVDASMVQRVVESNLAPRIRAVPGVQRVSVAGPGQDAIWVRPDLLKMQRFNVSASTLAASLGAATGMMPSGYVN
ncbi:efflux RND transporter permease subunit, partial [Klebsiella pneumoniae]|nr:efflux RND transporter permease subunit [Klebsiella pneumoniae]